MKIRQLQPLICCPSLNPRPFWSAITPQPEEMATAAKAAAQPAKRQKTGETRTLNDAHTAVKRVADGKVARATDQQIQDAKAGVEMFRTPSRQGTFEFTKMVEHTKGSKNLEWMRKFWQNLTSTNTTKEGANQKYYTRTS